MQMVQLSILGASDESTSANGEESSGLAAEGVDLHRRTAAGLNEAVPW